MAELRFYFGTMGSGKSTQALQIHHNLTKGGLACALLTQLDRKEGVVSSRLGVSAEATVIDESVDLLELARDLERETERLGTHTGLHAIVCDEAQFYQPHQVDQLARVVDELGVEVYAFGLLTSFQGQLFPGTQRLLELADRRFELQVEARCWCGARATHNARYVDGHQVYEGDLMIVGDADPAGASEDLLQLGSDGEQLDLDAPRVSYGLRCRRHWLLGGVEAAGHAAQPSLR